MNKIRVSLFLFAALPLLLLDIGSASAGGRVWKNHARPYTFLFGNHIDTHQETRLTNKGDLKGFFYITWTGETTDDGIPIAHHCTGPEDYEAGCFAGWLIAAKPCIEEVNGCRAMFLYHDHDHPVWLLGPRVVEGNLRGSRLDIVQPGSYTHFHWLTEESTDQHGQVFGSSIMALEELFDVDISVPTECNVTMAGDLTPGVICPGYFLEIQAIQTFAFEHGGQDIPVVAGVDNKTHLNLLTTIETIIEADLPPLP